MKANITKKFMEQVKKALNAIKRTKGVVKGYTG